MPRNRLPKVIKNYRQKGRRNQGRPIKRLIKVLNGSTSGPTPC